MSQWVRADESETCILLLLTVAFVLLAAALALLVPMFANFDEQSHLDRARHTAREPVTEVGPELRLTHGSWAALEAVRGGPDPLGVEGRTHRQRYLPFREYPGGDQPQVAGCPGGICQNIQYGHPPAWYLLAAPVTAVLEGQAFPRTVLALRLMNVALAIPLVPLAWCTAAQLWPASPRRRVGVAAAVALMGPLAYTTAAVNNDGLLLLAMAVAIATAARILRRGPTLGMTALLGVAVTVGLLTKVQMVLAAPVFGLVVLVAPAAHLARVRAAVVFALTAGIGAAWWLRSLLVDGSPLAPESSELLLPPTPGPWQDTSFVAYAAERLPTLVGRFWGTYSEPVTFPSLPVQVALSAAAAVLALSWLVVRGRRGPTAAGLRWGVLGLVPVALAAGTLYASYDAYLRNGELRGLAPRYLYPSAPVLALGAVASLAVLAARLPPRWSRRALLPAGTIVLAATGSIGTVAKAVPSSFGTGSWPEIVARVPAVSPMHHAMVVVSVLAGIWVVAVGLAAALMADLPSGPQADLEGGLRGVADRADAAEQVP